MMRPRRTRWPSYKILENAELRHGAPVLKRRRDLLGQQLRKTRARVRVEVVVPTLRQVQNARLAESETGERDSRERQPPLQIKAEEDDAKMYFLLQAKIKVEVKQEEAISENVVRKRLALIGYDTFDLKIPRNILDATTTRDFTTRIWGGSMRSTFPKIGKEFTHGLDDFMYISLLYDPHAPRWPGSPGLFFKFRDDGGEWPKIMRLIVRLRDNAWQYMGQYKLTATPPLTPDEWHVQSPKVKRKWANKLSGRRFDGGLKAKIVLRKRLGRGPTPHEVAIALGSNERFKATADEILRACDEGCAVVRVWCMKCVGYDEVFQRRIAAGS